MKQLLAKFFMPRTFCYNETNKLMLSAQVSWHILTITFISIIIMMFLL